MTAPDSSPAHDPYAAFRLRDFRNYMAGNFVFLVGLQMQKVAIGWEIYERTGSALHLGYVGLAQFAPQLLLAPFAGHVADAYNRKRVLGWALLVNALAALGLAWNAIHPAPLVVSYLLLIAIGAARAFWMPARSAILPRIVPVAIFGNAVSWYSSTFELAAITGPAVGGVLIGILRQTSAIYLINAAAVISFIALVARIHYEPNEQKSEVTLNAMSAGVRFVWNSKIVLAAILLDTFGVLFGGATALMPVYAKDILHVGPRGLGWLLAAPSVGAVTMAFIQAHRGPLRTPGRTLLMAVAGFGLVTILFGLSTHFWFSLLMLLALGAFDNISVVLRGTLVQVLTPDHMRGRVSSLNGLFIGTSNELGAFESGLAAQWLGPVTSVAGGGFATIVVVLGIAWLFPELRTLRRDELARPRTP
ncbi:MAG: MFS transporter [Acidobacteriota bacterium]